MNAAVVADVNAIPRGSKGWIRQSFSGANGMSFTVSVGVVRGARHGPVFANVAGQHGMEHIGPVVLRDFFDELDPEKLSGDAYVCPCANPLALSYDFEVFPENEKLPEPGTEFLKPERFGFKKREDLGAYNMNRCWPDEIAGPAKPDEGIAMRVARWLWKTMVAPADVVIDHHSVKRARKSYIFCEKEVIPWTPYLGIEAIWCTGPLRPSPLEYPYRRLCMQAIRQGKVGICIEYSVQHWIKEEDRAVGRFALFNTMKAMGMIDGEPEFRSRIWLIPGPYWEHTIELKAGQMGHAQFRVEEYQPLRQGDVIAEVRSLETNEIRQTITAPADCLMLHRTPRPVTKVGEWICHVTKDAELLAEPGKPYPKPPMRK